MKRGLKEAIAQGMTGDKTHHGARYPGKVKNNSLTWVMSGASMPRGVRLRARHPKPDVPSYRNIHYLKPEGKRLNRINKSERMSTANLKTPVLRRAPVAVPPYLAGRKQEQEYFPGLCRSPRPELRQSGSHSLRPSGQR